MKINKQGKWEYHGGINPHPVAIRFSSNAAPHASTERARYSVPEGKRAVLTGLSNCLVRVDNATVEGTVSILITKEDGGFSDSVLSEVTLGDATADNPALDTNVWNLPLNALESIVIDTSDGSTDGECQYNVNIAIIEFELFRD